MVLKSFKAVDYFTRRIKCSTVKQPRWHRATTMSGSGLCKTKLSHHTEHQRDTSDHAALPQYTSVGILKPHGAIQVRSRVTCDMKQSHLSEQQWDTRNDTETPKQVIFVPLKWPKPTLGSGIRTCEATWSHSRKQQWNNSQDTKPPQCMVVRNLGQHKATPVNVIRHLRWCTPPLRVGSQLFQVFHWYSPMWLGSVPGVSLLITEVEIFFPGVTFLCTYMAVCHLRSLSVTVVAQHHSGCSSTFQ